MDPQTLHTINVIEEAASQLIEVCRKNSPLYRQRPKQVAQVNRTAKWFLNALAGLRRSVDSPEPDAEQR
jgi:hypothetical protein